jgi:hypothetical protein
VSAGALADLPAAWARDPLKAAAAIRDGELDMIRSETAKDAEFRGRLVELVRMRLGREGGDDLLEAARHVLAACAMIDRAQFPD